MCVQSWCCIRRVALVFALCVLVEQLAACAGVQEQRVGAREERGAVSFERFGADARALAAVEPRTPSSHPPDELVAEALQMAEDASRAAAELRPGEAGPLRQLSVAERAVLEAHYGVDRALNLSNLRAAPLPDEERASVAQMRAAREGEIPPRMIDIHVLNTGERARVELFDVRGVMRAEAVDELSRLLRDQREGRVRSVQPRLLTILYFVAQHFDREIDVVSGYRVRGVNASDGSRHGYAAACDLRISGVSNTEIARFVERRFARIGVGVYPTSGFVHVDVRERSFFWTDPSGPGQRSRLRPRDPYARVRDAADATLRTPHLSEALLYGDLPVVDD